MLFCGTEKNLQLGGKSEFLEAWILTGGFMQVTIDGVPYVPPARFITDRHCHYDTSARRRFKTSTEQHMKHLPAGALVVVVDDGSKPAAVVPDGVQLLRHETSLGIVASKNASLSALMDAGCEHLFLWDDDAWPIADNWHLPTSNHPSRTWLTSFSIWLAAIS
jgi:hypothetical protein